VEEVLILERLFGAAIALTAGGYLIYGWLLLLHDLEERSRRLDEVQAELDELRREKEDRR
jgi:hypothetical protein